MYHLGMSRSEIEATDILELDWLHGKLANQYDKEKEALGHKPPEG